MKNLGDMMRQAQQMQTDMATVQEKLKTTAATGNSGGGIVSITLNGKGDMTKVDIDTQVVDPNDVELLQDLLLTAHNDARQKIELMMADEMKKVFGGMSLPPGLQALF